MCYSAPGPRCAGHTRTELAKAKRATAAALASGDENAYEKARHAEMVATTAWRKSPEGIKHLRTQGDHDLAFSYEQEREAKIDMVKFGRSTKVTFPNGETDTLAGMANGVDDGSGCPLFDDNSRDAGFSFTDASGGDLYFVHANEYIRAYNKAKYGATDPRGDEKRELDREARSAARDDYEDVDESLGGMDARMEAAWDAEAAALDDIDVADPSEVARWEAEMTARRAS